MQPKDFVEKTPENDKRLQRKFNKMCKVLDVQKASVDVPVLLFDEVGELMYSPKAVADQCKAMEKRIKEMKYKRENLSPTASQVSMTFDFPPLKPLLGESPSVIRDSMCDQDDRLDTSYEELWGNPKIESPASKIKYNFERSSQKNEHDSMNSKRKLAHLIPKVTELEKECSALSMPNKDHKALHKIKAFNGISDDCTDDVFSDIPSTKKNTPDLVYSTSSNRRIAKCKGKAKKSESPSLRSNMFTSISCASPKQDMMHDIATSNFSSNKSDSDDRSFEDFFSSSSLNDDKSRLSFGKLPRRSHSPPQPTATNKRSYGKKKSSEDSFDLDETNAKKRRKTVHAECGFIFKSLLSPKSKQERSPDPETVDMNKKKIRVPLKRKSCYQTRGEKIATVNPLQESELILSRNDQLIKDLSITQVTDSGVNKHPVQSLEKIITLMPCKTKGGLEPKEKAQHVTSHTVFEKPEDGMKTSKQSVENRGSDTDTRDGPSKMFNEEQIKCLLESKKTEKIKKTTRSLVMTSMCSEQQNTVIQVVKKFGGFFFTDHVCNTTSHVIAGNPRRTLNVLLGITRGCWIVSYDWVLWSLERGYWIPEEPYELSDHFPGAPISRLQRHLSAGEYQQDLLSSLPTVFISPHSQPPCDKLSEIVQLCGGKVSKTLRQAKICIGEFTGKMSPEMHHVSEKWLLDSVTQQTLHPLENFLLNQ
ncbi:microcephalin [Pelodytes ibericus]